MDKTLFKIAIASHRQGEEVADRIARYIMATYDTEGCDEEWFDERVNSILSSGWYCTSLTDADMWALLGAAIAHYDYDADLFFGVTSYGVLGHYIHDVARGLESDGRD